MKRIAFVTWQGAENIGEDDLLVAEILRKADISVEGVAWNTAETDWSAYDLIVVRSCRDYYEKIDKFLLWLDHLSTLSAIVLNPTSIMRWNAQKNYLLDFNRWGIPAVPTLWVTPNDLPLLMHRLRANNWNEVVVKPTVSSGGYETWRSSMADIGERRDALNSMLRHSQVMIQPYMPQIQEPGEWSFVFFDGAYSHAVLKRPRIGDFRVQSRFGGYALQAEPPKRLLAQAYRVIEAVGIRLPFVRVDGIDLNGTLLLMEFEAIEPILFLGKTDMAAMTFANAIAKRLTP